jgi:hypothetical protein
MIPSRATFMLVLLAVLSLAACDQPATRVRRTMPAPVPLPPGAQLEASSAQIPARLFPSDPPSPVVWNVAKGGFEFEGKPLRAEKVWAFDGATDGFVATHADVLPADGAGLSLKIGARDAILRTPRGLNVAGSNRSLVLIRLTRTAAVRRLDPTLYYSTAAHGETQADFAKPVFGGHPRLNDTVTMVFNMRQLASGGDDWKTSTIDQVRLDLDDGAGGAFVIHQVAIAQDPGGIFPQPQAPPKVDASATKPGQVKPATGRTDTTPKPKKPAPSPN